MPTVIERLVFHIINIHPVQPHSLVGRVQDLRTGGSWFDLRARPIFFPRIYSSFTAVHYFDDGYMGKHPVAWKEYCADYWLKQLQESMGSCTGRPGITEIRLKTALNTSQSIIY